MAAARHSLAQVTKQRVVPSQVSSNAEGDLRPHEKETPTVQVVQRELWSSHRFNSLVEFLHISYCTSVFTPSPLPFTQKKS